MYAHAQFPSPTMRVGATRVTFSCEALGTFAVQVLGYPTTEARKPAVRAHALRHLQALAGSLSWHDGPLAWLTPDRELPLLMLGDGIAFVMGADCAGMRALTCRTFGTVSAAERARRLEVRRARRRRAEARRRRPGHRPPVPDRADDLLPMP
ncbi:hypothetical protein GKE82_24645 [Conexibacter sp. W3-3-2]|uniref:hypothetical protein n=1 Tax=Conexibacter sp. W3-3-2 TaxID=2675227 RepID=UPI0012B9D867|nr:hypothetical protein [Conexibacter sp. W3-3-2]MTD47397.1 hypothetical protein [Conexibacter sp. W3-3-2]